MWFSHGEYDIIVFNYPTYLNIKQSHYLCKFGISEIYHCVHLLHTVKQT